MITRKEKGATLGLVPCIILIITLIGITFYYLVQFFGGNKQLLNGTDSGALGAARQLLTVGLQSSEVSNLPQEFQALGVDSTGTPTGINSDGTPNITNAIFNVYAFNRAAGFTLLVALNAAEDGSPTAIANANTFIAALNTFGTKLNADLAAAPQLATTFSNLASSNNTNMLGSNSSITLGNNGNLQLASVPGEGGSPANVYFNSNVYANDTTMSGWVQNMTANSGLTSQINSRYNQSDPSAQAGQPFVFGYQPIDMSAITGNTAFTTKIYACALNPSQTPHLIDSGRFNNPGTPAACYAPNNSISAQGLATSTTNSTNLLCSALACAMLGAYDNQYPINMPYGWIRIQNGKDAIAANPNTLANVFPPLTGTGLNGVSYTVPDVGVPLYASNGNTIFNIQLWTGPGGEGGIYESNNHVFGTVDYEDPNNPLTPGPPGYSVTQEFNAWVTANTNPCTGNCNPDVNGLNPALDPNIQQSNGTYLLGYQSPTPNMRAATVNSNGTVTTSYNQLATVQNMLGITSYSGPCITYALNDPGDTSPYCADVPLWSNNYFNPNDYWVPAYDSGTQPTGGLTDLEAIKGEIVGALDRLWITIRNDGISNPEDSSQFQDYTFTLTVPQNPSGSKVYDQTGLSGYATPQDVPSVAFGTIGTPLQLIKQLNTVSPDTPANCGDASSTSTQWTNVTTPLGKLLQRCQMIVGSTTVADVISLLSTYPIDLNEYQYIYLPVGASKLAISNSPPAFLQQYPEFSSPGSTQPDGTTIFSCQDAGWTRNGNGQTSLDINYSLVNSDMNYGANGSSGDDTTSGPPFTSYSGNLSTWDGMTFTPSSGRFWFLGNLQFGNYVSGGGTTNTFGEPN